jgi:chemotaxis protein CheY-P-specific phosphatase CheC
MQNDWILKDLDIRQDWNKKGLYTGNVTFTNGVKMQMSLLLDNDKCTKMVALLKDEIIENAQNLGDMLIKSMPLALNATPEEQPKPTT